MAASLESEALKASIIVPFHDSAKYIERCVQALMGQNYPPDSYEIVLVDNNSSDGSVEIVKGYSRVRLLHERKPGAYAARNHGVAFSSGSILVFTDSDCIASPDWLKEILATFSQPEVGLVQGRRLFGDDGSTLSMVAAYEAETHSYIFSEKVEDAVFGYTNNMAVRREVFESCGPFLETARGADSIFVDRVVRKFSKRVLRYARAACIRHLEIDSVKHWLGKKALYGRSFQRHRHERPLHRALTPAERSAIFKEAKGNGGYSGAQAAVLYGVIVIGKLSFIYGRITVGLMPPDK